MQKASKYITQIIDAKEESDATDILVALAKDLGIGQSHGQLMDLKKRLALYQEAFRATRDRLRNEAIPSVSFLQEIRFESAMAFQEVSDELGFEINKLKIFMGDDRRTEIRGNILTELVNDEEFKILNKTKSISALKEVYGIHDSYKEWLTCSSVSYGLWNSYRSLLESMKLFIDAVAGRLRTEQSITKIDIK